jgi:hypothetical protein
MQASTYSPYFAPGHLVPTILGPDPSSVASQLGQHCVQQAVPIAQQKIPRSDRLEVCKHLSPVNYITNFFRCYFLHFLRPNIKITHTPTEKKNQIKALEPTTATAKNGRNTKYTLHKLNVIIRE